MQLADVENLRLLRWQIDQQTARAAADHSLRIKANSPLAQVGEDGKNCGFNPQSWNSRVVQPASWPGDPKCTPEQIMNQFREGRYTQGLAMVAGWGGMGRRPKAVWGARKIEHIEQTLSSCALNIRETQSVGHSWAMLTGLADGHMGWTAVMTSKTLHFLCRSLGFEQNPPAAIDGAVIRGIVWRAFRNSIPLGERPKNWEGNTFSAYCRYMTAIMTWAKQRTWTTKQMEATIFAEYGAEANHSC